VTSVSSITNTPRGCRVEVDAYVGARARLGLMYEWAEVTDSSSSGMGDGCSRTFTSSGN